MQLDALLANMEDFDYICDESVTWVNDNIIGNGYTAASDIERMNTDPLIPDNERRVWIRNARRMFSESAAMRLGADYTETDEYRLTVNRIVVAKGSLSDCQQCQDNMSWVTFSNVVDGVISRGNIDEFKLAETTMGETYTSKANLLALPTAIERKIVDVEQSSEIWETV